MKHKSSISLSLLIAISFLLSTCHKDDVIQGTCVDGIKNQDESGVDCGGPCPACNAAAAIPVVSTTPVSSITATKAQTGGTITNSGNASVTSAGVCWSTAPNPTIYDSYTNDFPFPDSFTSILQNLYIATTYYARAYAINSAGIAYGNEITFTTGSQLTIGDTYAGGLVFYLDSTNLHGYVCAESNQGYTQWGCNSTNVTGAAGTAIGTGQANTAAIVATGCAAGYAANICSDLVLNGYSDWFLPSREELRLMALNLGASGAGDFGTDQYWSSTQSGTNYAVSVNMTDANTYTYYKDNFKPFRAIRAF
jgi:hypothetical protein